MLSRLRNLARELGLFGPLFLGTFAGPLTGAALLLGGITRLAPWLRERELLGAAVFVAGSAALSGCAMVPGQVLALLGGWTFGIAVGIPLTLIGTLGGAAIGYHFARFLTEDRLARVCERRPRLERLRAALVDQDFRTAWMTVGLVRLSPAMPFAATNLIMASSRVPFAAFLLGTGLGVSPRILAVVVAGAGLSELDFDRPIEAGGILAGVGALLLSLLGLAAVGQRALAKMEARATADAPPQ